MTATTSIRVLSVRQPFADEIIYGDKWNEMRTWSTPYRGRFYIHASRWDGPQEETEGQGLTGAIIGHVDLLACCTLFDLRQVRYHLTDGGPLSDRLVPLKAILERLPESGWEHGDFDVNWILGNPHALIRPYKIAGKLNLWHLDVYESDVEAEPTRPVELFEPIPAAKTSKRI